MLATAPLKGPPELCDAAVRRTGRLDRLVSRAVLQTQLLPPQIRVRCSPDSRHDSDGPEQLRCVPQGDILRLITCMGRIMTAAAFCRTSGPS